VVSWMGYRVERFKATLIFVSSATQFVVNIFTIISFCAGIVGAGITFWTKKYRDYAFPLSAFAIGIFVAVVAAIAKIVRSKSPPMKWLIRGYRWVRAEYLYCIHDPRHHSISDTILLEAVRPGVVLFEDRYQWSGRGREELPKIISPPGATLLGPPIQHGLWKYYYVHLGRELSVGERIEVKISQELYDDEGTFEPFLAKTIAEPLDHLVLRVVFPQTSPPREAVCNVHSAAGPAGVVIQSTPCQYDSVSRELRWEIPKPVFGRRYEIRWEW
jgi:hypothetical protein